MFSRPRLSMTSSPLRGSPILLMSTSSSRASMVWTDTVFGVARAVAQFELERGSVDAAALVRAVMHSRARSQETV